jgi:putative tryptophan/tyrosine transport system substrate-binding protein
MRRRQFITFLGGAAVTWPLAARGQQSATPQIGYLSSKNATSEAGIVAAMCKGLEGRLCRR